MRSKVTAAECNILDWIIKKSALEKNKEIEKHAVRWVHLSLISSLKLNLLPFLIREGFSTPNSIHFLLISVALLICITVQLCIRKHKQGLICSHFYYSKLLKVSLLRKRKKHPSRHRLKLKFCESKELINYLLQVEDQFGFKWKNLLMWEMEIFNYILHINILVLPEQCFYWAFSCYVLHMIKRVLFWHAVKNINP